LKQFNRKHLPQIEYFFQGNYIYPFVTGLHLREMIALREEWINYDNPVLYRKNDRKIFRSQLLCIEQCIRILFSEATPLRALALKQKERRKRESLNVTNEKVLAIMKDINVSSTSRKHLPQIECFFEGSNLYPFLKGASLRELVAMREAKLKSGTRNYNKDARNTFYDHLGAIESCIVILMFANVDPTYYIEQLEKNETYQTRHPTYNEFLKAIQQLKGKN